MMLRTCLFVLMLFTAVGAHAQPAWTYNGPGLFTPVDVAENSTYVYFLATRGTDGSGAYLYRSADGGKTWANTTGNLITAAKPLGLNISAVGAADGLVAASVTVSSSQTDLYTSSNDGATWTRRSSLPAGVTTVYDLHVLAPSTVVAYAMTGSSQAKFVVSTDGGVTWTVQPEVFNPVGQSPPIVTGSYFAAFLTRRVNNTNQTGLYVSTDLGASWTQVQSVDVFATGYPVWADGTRLYYLVGTTLRWSDNVGASWQSKTISPFAAAGTSSLGAIISRGNRFVAQGLVTKRPLPGGGTESFNDDVVATSSDMGTSWQLSDPDSTILRSRYNRGGSPATLGIVATRTGFLSANVTTGTFGNRLYYSADGHDWDPVNVYGFTRDLGDIVPLGGALLAFEDETIGGGAGFFRSDDGGTSWRYVTKLNYGFNTNEGCASGLGNGLAARVGTKVVAVCETDVYHSTDGLNFTKVGAGVVPTNRTKMLVEDSGTLYLLTWSQSLSGYGGQNAVLYTSSDLGLTWTMQAGGLRTLERPSVAGSRVILTDRVQVSYSTDGGATFTNKTGLFGSADAGTAATPTALFAGSGFERIINGVYLNRKTFHRSRDGGATWQDLIADGVVQDGPRSLHADGSLLIGVFTDSVAVSDNDGQTWRGLATGWPAGGRGENAFVHGNRLYVQVLFEGLYSAPLAAFGVTVASDAPQRAGTVALAAWPSPASGPVQVRYTVEQAQHVRVAVYDVLGRHVHTLDEGHVPPGAHLATWIERSAPGLYVIRLTTADGGHHTRTVVRR